MVIDGETIEAYNYVSIYYRNIHWSQVLLCFYYIVVQTTAICSPIRQCLFILLCWKLGSATYTFHYGNLHDTNSSESKRKLINPPVLRVWVRVAMFHFYSRLPSLSVLTSASDATPAYSQLVLQSNIALLPPQQHYRNACRALFWAS